MPQLAQGVHLLPPGCTEDLSRLRPLDGEKDFVWCLNLPREYISSPLDALRTFSSFSPALARRRGGLLTCLKTREGVEVFHLVPPIAERR